MAGKNIDFGMPGVGEIDNVLHNQGVSDLSWLAVDEAEYRAFEALPKQNLDMIPELQKALSFEPGDMVPHIVPLRPHTIVNRNPTDSFIASETDLRDPIRNRVAGYVMQGHSIESIKSRLASEFPSVDLKLASSEIDSVISESGVLGAVYINAAHFPRCSQFQNKTASLPKSIKKSLVVLAKSNCADCTCNSAGNCSVFKKPLVNEVKYDRKLASDLGLSVPKDGVVDWKEFIKVGLEKRSLVVNPDGVQTFATQPAKKVKSYSDEEISEYSSKVSSTKSDFILTSEYKKFSKRMMDGADDREAMRLSSDLKVRDLEHHYNVLGRTWLDVDVLGGCRNTLSFIASKRLSPTYLLKRIASCSICNNKPDGACASLCRKYKIVATAPEITKRDVAEAISSRVKTAGFNKTDVKTFVERVNSGENLLSVLASVNSHRPQESVKVASSNVKAYYGRGVSEPNKAAVNALDVENFLGQQLNKGLSGSRLASSLLSRYSREDLKSVPSIKPILSSMDGVQGVYHVDPSVYSDYGLGCDTGAKLFRKNGPKHLLASSKCTGCTHQSSLGWCSKYAKTMVRTVPEEVILASRSKLPLPVITAPITNPVEKYELSSALDMPSRSVKASQSIDIDSYSIGD